MRAVVRAPGKNWEPSGKRNRPGEILTGPAYERSANQKKPDCMMQSGKRFCCQASSFFLWNNSLSTGK